MIETMHLVDIVDIVVVVEVLATVSKGYCGYLGQGWCPGVSSAAMAGGVDCVAFVRRGSETSPIAANCVYCRLHKKDIENRTHSNNSRRSNLTYFEGDLGKVGLFTGMETGASPTLASPCLRNLMDLKIRY